MSVKYVEFGLGEFALRTGERLTILEDRPDQSPGAMVMGVAILHTPEFPGEREKTYREVKQYAVIACYYYKHLEGWGFMALEPQTKDLIGEMLVEGNAVAGRWYWAVIDHAPRQAA